MWSFSYKNWIIRIRTSCSLKISPIYFQLFLSMHILSQKHLLFTYYNVKIHPRPFTSLIFSKILISNKNTDMFLWRRVCWVGIPKSSYILFFPVPFPSLKLVYFYWKSILRKSDFTFSPKRNSFRLFNTLERDYLILLRKYVISWFTP